MDEIDNKEIEQSTLPEERTEARDIIRKALIAAGLTLAVYLIYSVLQIAISPDRNIQQIYLIPEDAAFILQSSNPVNDWKEFSNSAPWQTLKQAKPIEEIAERVNRLDSIVQSNQSLLSLVGKRDMMISIHRTRMNDWDYLMVLDMQKTSKLDMLKDQIELILRLADYSVTHRIYNEINILEMRDPQTREILYAAFVDNHFIASYTPRLVEAAIDARKKPKIGLEHGFIEADKRLAGKGLYRIFVNYAVLPHFMSIYAGSYNEYINLFSQSMDFAGLYFQADKQKLELKGHTLRRDTADPYITALLNSGRHSMKAHQIMSARTAFYSNIGFSNPQTFIRELEGALSINDKELYDSYVASRKNIESRFDILLDDHFLSWMSGEFALSQSEPGLLGREPELILAVRAKSMKDARKNMAFIEKRIKSKTPVRIKTVDYKGFEINYLEMKGFFRLFFGGLFDKFEKPYYTYIDEYVVFSNQAASLLSFIEDYEQKNLMKDNQGFSKALSHFDINSTIFLYVDIHRFYPQLQRMVNTKTWAELQTNKNVVYSFPYWSMQIVSNKESASIQYTMDYETYVPNPVIVTDADEEDREMNENAGTEKEQLSELKRFYIEKFQGNILREFYPEGALKSETEVKEGRLHGRHREFYETGKLKVRGKYINNRPKGTWKYYTEEGKFERKEKF